MSGTDHLYGVSKDSSSSNLIWTDVSSSPSPPPSHPPHHLPPSPFHPSLLPSPPHLPPLTTSLPLSRSDKKASSSQPEEKKAYLEPENVVLLPMVVGRLHDASRLPPRNEVNEWLATNCECVCV